jgi:hypothetical protein
MAKVIRFANFGLGKPLSILDSKYLPPLKRWQYSVRARRSLKDQDKIWLSPATIAANYPTYNITGRGTPLRPPTAKDKLIRLIRKTRKSTGKTYVQRVATDPYFDAANKAPLTAKKYIKGVDFSANRRYARFRLNQP